MPRVNVRKDGRDIRLPGRLARLLQLVRVVVAGHGTRRVDADLDDSRLDYDHAAELRRLRDLLATPASR